jgi:hypothetical protein
MRIFGAMALLVLLASACGSEKQAEVPVDVLPEERFSLLMTDMMLLEAVYKQRMTPEDDPRDGMVVHYADIFKKHNTTEAEFRRAFEYWTMQPEAMMRIYDAVLAEIDRLEVPGAEDASEENLQE